MFYVKESVLHIDLFNSMLCTTVVSQGWTPSSSKAYGASLYLHGICPPEGSVLEFAVFLSAKHLLTGTIMTGSTTNFPYWDGNINRCTLKFKWTKWLQGLCRFLHLEETADSPSRKLVSSLLYINPVNSQLTFLVFLSSKYAYVCILKGTEAFQDLRESQQKKAAVTFVQMKIIN